MFENVVAMRVNDKRDISRFLEVRERRGFGKGAGAGRVPGRAERARLCHLAAVWHSPDAVA